MTCQQPRLSDHLRTIQKPQPDGWNNRPIQTSTEPVLFAFQRRLAEAITAARHRGDHDRGYALDSIAKLAASLRAETADHRQVIAAHIVRRAAAVEASATKAVAAAVQGTRDRVADMAAVAGHLDIHGLGIVAEMLRDNLGGAAKSCAQPFQFNVPAEYYHQHAIAKLIDVPAPLAEFTLTVKHVADNARLPKRRVQSAVQAGKLTSATPGWKTLSSTEVAAWLRSIRQPTDWLYSFKG